MSRSDVAPPLQRGRYRLVEIIGRGGMAIVYRGFDELFATPLAIKVLNPALASNPTLRERFEQEARTMARLHQNPHVVKVLNFGQDEADQRMFIAMELMDGGSLQGRLDRMGPLPPRVAVEAIVAVLVALEAAHGQSVVHRDVKPSNVLISDAGVPKVGDFGIARILDSDKRKTRSGAGVGTWAFMAPEQKRSARTVDLRADVYATGATLFALLTNQDPDDLDRPNAHDGTMAIIPDELRVIVQRATQFKPEDRYPSAAAMREALVAAIPDLPPNPPGITSLADTGRGSSGRDPAGGPVTIVPMAITTHPDRPWLPAKDLVEPTSSEVWPPPLPLTARPAFWAGALALAALVIGIALWSGHEPPPTRPPAPAQGAAEVASGLGMVGLGGLGLLQFDAHRPVAGGNDLVSGLVLLAAGGGRLLRPPPGIVEPTPPPPPIIDPPATLKVAVIHSDNTCEIEEDGLPILRAGVAQKTTTHFLSGTHTVTCIPQSGPQKGTPIVWKRNSFAPGSVNLWEVEIPSTPESAP